MSTFIFIRNTLFFRHSVDAVNYKIIDILQFLRKELANIHVSAT